MLLATTAMKINAELFLNSLRDVLDFFQLCRRQVLLEAPCYLETGSVGTIWTKRFRLQVKKIKKQIQALYIKNLTQRKQGPYVYSLYNFSRDDQTFLTFRLRTSFCIFLRKRLECCWVLCYSIKTHCLNLFFILTLWRSLRAFLLLLPVVLCRDMLI